MKNNKMKKILFWNVNRLGHTSMKADGIDTAVSGAVLYLLSHGVTLDLALFCEVTSDVSMPIADIEKIAARAKKSKKLTNYQLGYGAFIPNNQVVHFNHHFTEPQYANRDFIEILDFPFYIFCFHAPSGQTNANTVPALKEVIERACNATNHNPASSSHASSFFSSPSSPQSSLRWFADIASSLSVPSASFSHASSSSSSSSCPSSSSSSHSVASFYFIIVGDFNRDCDDGEIATLLNMYSLKKLSGKPTFPANRNHVLPYKTYDYVITNFPSGVKCETLEYGPCPSDHYPILITIDH